MIVNGNKQIKKFKKKESNRNGGKTHNWAEVIIQKAKN